MFFKGFFSCFFDLMADEMTIRSCGVSDSDDAGSLKKLSSGSDSIDSLKKLLDYFPFFASKTYYTGTSITSSSLSSSSGTMAERARFYFFSSVIISTKLIDLSG